ncbi:TPA: hypothetical protein EYN98_10100 [Candidatus Poribacteria bacterium]|nr:hypothetical protein [Candidatus Poribacteria bacterium]HIA66393.1 hypothetical protein [Candidatus Poribacteria bacterium]HIC02016.1 hypothetical protein [Candidatus Poribacteria bacterium]
MAQCRCRMRRGWGLNRPRGVGTVCGVDGITQGHESALHHHRFGDGHRRKCQIILGAFDKLMPPVSPMKTDIEASFDRDKVNWNLQSGIQPLQDRAEWRLVVRSKEITDLSVVPVLYWKHINW